MVEQLLQEVRFGARWLGQRVLARPFVRHVGVLTVANGVGAVLSFVQGVLVARWLGPELYGVAALVMSVPALVYTFFDARSAEMSIKYLGEFHAQGERERAAAVCRLGYLVDFGVATLAFLSVLAITPWASRAVVHRPELAWLLVAYSLAFLPRALQGTSYAILAVHGRFVMLALIESVTMLVRVALVLGLVLAGWGVVGVVLGNAVGTALIGVLYAIPALTLMVQSWGSTSWSGMWSALRRYRRDIVRFVVLNDLNVLLGMIPKQLDIVLLGYFRNPTEVGFYKLAKSLAGSVGYLVSPLQSVTYPDLARLRGMQATPALWQRVRKLALQVGLPLGIVGVVGTALIPPIVSVMIGENYRPAVPAIQILLMGSAISLAFFWLRPLFLAQGWIKFWLFNTVIVVALFAIASPFATWRWGYVGLSVSWLSIIFLGHSMALLMLVRLGRRWLKR